MAKKLILPMNEASPRLLQTVARELVAWRTMGKVNQRAVFNISTMVSANNWVEKRAVASVIGQMSHLDVKLVEKASLAPTPIKAKEVFFPPKPAEQLKLF